MAALLFLKDVPFPQSDPSNIDVRLFREINNAQTTSKRSLLGVTANSVYPIVIAAPISLAAYGLVADRNESFESGVLVGTFEVLSYSISSVLKVGI